MSDGRQHPGKTNKSDFMNHDWKIWNIRGEKSVIRHNKNPIYLGKRLKNEF